VQLNGQSAEEIDSSISSFYNLDSVVVTAEYGATKRGDAVHQVHTISEEEIRKRGQLNLSEILQNELNLNIRIDPILGQTASIQGVSRENVLILVDGVPVIGRLNGGIDLSQIPSANIERIEIIKGAVSAQYGSHASGGVINIITKSRQSSSLDVDIQQQLESQNLRQTQVSAGVQSQRWLLRVNGNYFHWQPAPVDSLRLFDKIELENGEEFKQRRIPWSPKSQWSYGASLAYRLGSHSRFEYAYQGFREELWRYGEKRRLVFMPYAIDQRFYTTRRDHRLRIRSDWGRWGQFESITAWNQFLRTRDNHRFDVEADRYEEEVNALDSNRFSSLLHRTKWNFKSGNRWSGQWGGEALLDRAQGDRIVDSLQSPIDEAQMLHLASWLSLRYQATDALTLQGQFRYNYNSRYKSPLIPGFNIKYTPHPDWTVRASYARGFRAPSLKELFIEFIDVNHFIVGNTDLRAETSHNINVSSEHRLGRFLGHHSALEFHYFYNRLTDRISLAEFQQLQFTYFNIDEFESQGINASITLEKKGKYRLQSSASYMQQSNAVPGTQTRRLTPVWESRNALQFPFPLFTAVKMDVMHRFFGRQTQFFLDENEDLREGFVGGYHLLNISAHYSFAGDRFTLGAGVKNALNQTQVRTRGGQGGAHSGSGNRRLVQRDRSYFVRLQYRLKSGM
jgi:outer membrane receptor for ferrienterochelin and colicins